MQQVLPSTSPQPVMTPSAGASLPAIARLEGVRAGVDPHLDEGPLVDEQVDALARGQLAALVLLGDLLLAAAELRRLAALVQVVGRAVQCTGFAVHRRLPASVR